MDNTQEQASSPAPLGGTVASSPTSYLWRDLDIQPADALTDIRWRVSRLSREAKQMRDRAQKSQHAADEANDEANHVDKVLKEYEAILARLEQP